MHTDYFVTVFVLDNFTIICTTGGVLGLDIHTYNLLGLALLLNCG